MAQPLTTTAAPAAAPSTEPLSVRYARMAHRGFAPRPTDAALRALDVAIAGTILLVLSPVIATIALLLRITSGSPVFYRGMRVGRAGELFTMVKFRTLKPDAETRLGPYYGPELTRRTELELTRMGRWLRASYLDEIPQLWNVLRGDMSFVGPRPERPYFVEQLSETIPFYQQRHAVKPGITGWAQVKYRYGSSVEDAIEKLRYDLYYIKHLSIVFDLTIVIDTVKVILLRRGAQ